MEVDPIQKIQNSLIQGRDAVIEKNKTRILSPQHIEMINEDIIEEIDTLLKVVHSINVLLVGRYQSGKTTLFNLLTGQNRPVGSGIIPCSKESAEYSHKILKNVAVHDTPGTGDKNMTEENIQEMISKTSTDILVLVIDGLRATDETLLKEHQKLVRDISDVYKKQTGENLEIAIVLTKMEKFDEESEEMVHIKSRLKSYIPNYELIIKKDIEDIAKLNLFIQRISTHLNQRILTSLSTIRTRCSHAIIWRNAGKVALYSLIPGLDIAMYIILTDTVDLLLCALYGKDIASVTTGIPTIINGLTLLGRGIHISANILSKVAELSVVFYAVGTIISAITNSTGVVVSGYWTLNRLKDIIALEESEKNKKK